MGEGIIKYFILDVYIDFIFVVMGEEFGLIVCLFFVVLFCFVVMCGLLCIVLENDLFV